LLGSFEDARDVVHGLQRSGAHRKNSKQEQPSRTEDNEERKDVVPGNPSLPLLASVRLGLEQELTEATEEALCERWEASESGVALRFPPHSKTGRRSRRCSITVHLCASEFICGFGKVSWVFILKGFGVTRGWASRPRGTPRVDMDSTQTVPPAAPHNSDRRQRRTALLRCPPAPIQLSSRGTSLGARREISQR
jgi:hypothetical protein